MVYGGRSSPLHPTKGLFRVTFDPTEPPGAAVKLDVEEMVCTGDAPLLRWRHTASIVSHKGEAVKPRFSASCSFISISTRCFSLQTKTFCSSLVEGTSRRPLWEVATGCVWTTCAGLRFARVLVGACCTGGAACKPCVLMTDAGGGGSARGPTFPLSMLISGRRRGVWRPGQTRGAAGGHGGIEAH